MPLFWRKRISDHLAIQLAPKAPDEAREDHFSTGSKRKEAPDECKIDLNDLGQGRELDLIFVSSPV